MTNISGGKNRISNALIETIEDRIKLVEQAFCDSVPSKLFSRVRPTPARNYLLNEMPTALNRQNNYSSSVYF